MTTENRDTFGTSVTLNKNLKLWKIRILQKNNTFEKKNVLEYLPTENGHMVTPYVGLNMAVTSGKGGRASKVRYGSWRSCASRGTGSSWVCTSDLGTCKSHQN